MRAVGSCIVLLVAITLMCAGSVRAQASGQQFAADQYTQEDSHPVRIVGYILSPIGVVLEYGIARPLHYLATNSFLQPVLDPARDSDEWSEFYGGGAGGQIPLPPVPSAAQAGETEKGLAEQDLGTERLLPAPGGAANSGSGDALPPAPKNAGQPIGGQPILH